jgi:3-deoxy-D-manno-octulosonic-acid transferase
MTRKDTRKRILHFLGFFYEESGLGHPKSETDWFHAVSYGETKLAFEYMRQGIDRGYITGPIIFTTTIENALQYAIREKKALDVPVHCYFFPLDFLPIIKGFLNTTKAKRVFITETDFWPELLYQLRKKNINHWLINGRLSEALTKFYLYIQGLSEPMFRGINKLYLQYDVDEKRARALANKCQCEVTGNAKLDLPLPEPIETNKKQVRPGVIFGSIHPDEFHIAIEAKKTLPSNCLITLAPRNINTANLLIKQLKNKGYTYSTSSSTKSLHPSTDFLIINEMGKLPSLYAHYSLSVICGSFNNVGSHNFFESISQKTPTFIGPCIRNISHDANDYIKKGYLNQAKDSNELIEMLKKYFDDPRPYLANAINAHNYLMSQRGIISKTWKDIAQKS